MEKRMRANGNSVTWLIAESIFVLLIAALLCIPSYAAEDSVCARVKIEIKQEMTLERQAFDAHMRINNGLTHIQLEDVHVTVTFADEQRNPVVASSDRANKDALFFIDLSSMENINNVGGSGVVAPATTADIHWLIIPTIGASDGVPQGTLYYVGATLTYTIGGEEHVTEVTPDYIYVKPLPQITLDYFLTKDVYGDDAFTPAIEPPVPFSLGVRASNNGTGVAKGLKINSAQPKIEENETGLLIGFVITGSEVNGKPFTPSLLVDFGDIQPDSASVAWWTMTCSLSGRFVEFLADFTHSDELGGELTSVLEATNTHFLVRDVLVDLPGRDGIRDFLALEGEAYTVYESENIDTSVTDQSGSSSLTGSGSQYTLTTPVTQGFMVVKLSDPLGGQKPIKEVIRSDGKRIKPENAWLSKTRVGSGPWQHFVYLFDSNSTGSYTVYFKEPEVAHAPVLQFVPDRPGLEETTLSFFVEASDPDGTTPGLSASPLPAGARFTDEGNGTGTFSWTPVAGQAGLYELTFRASDGALEDTKKAALTIRSRSDSDGDGMRDDWERQHFGNLDRDGNGDYDGDGLTDLEEFLQGKIPTESNAPSTPVIASPEDKSEVVSLQPELVVENSTDPDGDDIIYDFEVYSDEGMETLVASALDFAETPATTSWTVTQELTENTWYFWRVRATDGFGFSPWAYGSLFVNTQNEAPGPFNISSPQDGNEVDTLTPTLEVTNSFDVDEDALTYSFLVYDDSAMTTPVASVAGVAEEGDGTTSWTVDQALDDNTRYYWRAVVTDEHGLTAETAMASFFVNTANDAPDAPAILSPADGAAVNVQALDLVVANASDLDEDALTYHFELDTVNTFDSTALINSGNLLEGSNTTSWSVSDLQDNTWYFWRVKANDGAADSPWTQGSFFVNTANDDPTTPTLKNPGEGTWVSTLTPTLEVNASTDIDNDPLTYRFEVYADADLTQLIAEGVAQEPGWVLPSPLSDNTWYYWTVRAEDGNGGLSPWMEAAAFFTDSDGQNDPPSISLEEPALDFATNGDSVTIRWEDGDPETNAEIALYYDTDLAGEDGVLIAGGLEEDPDGAGDTYAWDISGLSDGTYGVYAVISDGEQSASGYAPGMITIDRTAPGVEALPAGGTYFSPQSVALASDEPAEIYYTTDGSEPTTESSRYVSPVEISEQSISLKFIAVDAAGNQSAIVTEEYTIQDTDNDGMLDSWELEHFGNLLRHGTGDADNDGLTNLDEYQRLTDPMNPDTDEDDMSDGWEVDHQLNPLVNDQAEDPDEDGFTNWQESFAGTDPHNPDSKPLPPEAVAGDDANVATGSLVTLDGSASYDPEGATITFLWSFLERPQDSTAALSDPTSPQPAFAPDLDGTYVILLTVSDGMLEGDDDVVIISATPNVPPNARAGDDVDVSTGTPITLDGSASDDPDNGPQALSYRWIFDSIPLQSGLSDDSIVNGDQPVAGFAPDADGTYTLRLRVSDGEAFCDDTVQVRATTANVPPAADAGDDFAITLGETAFLDSTASNDLDEGPMPLTYGWRFVSLPAGSLLSDADISGADTATPSFTPDAAGTYVLELSVYDGTDTDYDNVAVTVEETAKPGDLDGDGVVGQSDYYIFRSTLGKCSGDTGFIADADYDADGCVTLSDYRIWYIYYRSQ